MSSFPASGIKVLNPWLVQQDAVLIAIWPIGALEVSNREYGGISLVEQLSYASCVIFSGDSRMNFPCNLLRSLGVNQLILPVK